MRNLLPLFAFVLFAACCHPNPPAPPLPPAPVDLAAPAVGSCTLTPDVKPTDICPNLFTDEGLACVRCPGAEACIDQADEIYCVKSGCALDRLCKVHRPVNPFERRRQKE